MISLLFLWSLLQFELKDRPFVGKKIALGGFSGLCYQGTVDGKWKFLTHTDRGPNGDEVEMEDGAQGRPFFLPSFVPRLVRFEIDPKTKAFNVESQTPLAGTSGLPFGREEMPEGFTTEIPLNEDEEILDFDPRGVDPEGIACGKDFWLGEEYGPSLLHVSQDGRVMARYLPKGAIAAGAEGVEAIPASFARRKLNRGFEGVALQGKRLFAFLQSPLKKKSKQIPVLEFDTVSKTTQRELTYTADSSDAKIGDVTPYEDGLLVLEQSDDYRRIYFVSLSRLEKRLVVDISNEDLGEKVEGMAVLDKRTLALINDNDFDIGGTEPIHLTIVELPSL